ncbi:MAG: histidinol-phosphatase [Actinomycetia bacterium]|nr:histidinol-phosphatase [Actinomycetes bacterium]
MTDDLAFALRLADAADALTLERFGALDLRVDTKPDLTPVSDADRATEELIRALIAEERPADAVIGEEFGTSGSASRSWIVDPIDGTKNYVRGVPVWATLIALTNEIPATDTQSITLGVVSAPALGRRWWASRGTGAWLTTGGAPVPIHVSGVSELSNASLSFSEWNDPAWELGNRRASFDRLLRSAWRSRAYGDFWSHMMVAEGSADAALEPELNAWDMAALVPIVEEAGGTITALDGSSPMVGGNAVSSNGLLHPAVLGAFTAS